MTRKLFLAPVIALTLTASPAMAQSAQPAGSTQISTVGFWSWVGMLLPAIQKVREAA